MVTLAHPLPPSQGLGEGGRVRSLDGWRFRRQQAIGPFIADFYCDALHRVIEVDDSSHIGNQNYNAQRTCWLNNHGCTVIRFWNDDVLHQLELIENEIQRVARNLAAQPLLSSEESNHE